MNNKDKSKRKELFDLVVQILREQFQNIAPNKDKVNRYLDEKFIRKIA